MIVHVTHSEKFKRPATISDRSLGFSSFTYVRLTVPRDVEYAVGVALEKLGHHVAFRTINGGNVAFTSVINPQDLPKTVEIPD